MKICNRVCIRKQNAKNATKIREPNNRREKKYENENATRRMKNEFIHISELFVHT